MSEQQNETMTESGQPTVVEQDSQQQEAAAPRKQSVVSLLFRLQSLFGLIAVFIAGILLSPETDGTNLFLTGSNLLDVVRAVSEIGIVAIGVTFVILIGGIDLSVGSVLGMAGVGVAVLMVDNSLGVLPAILIVLAGGLVFGALQGMAVSLFGIQAFIVTLAGLNIARGIARIISGGEEVPLNYGTAPGDVPVVFSLLGERTFNGVVPIPALIFLGVAALAVIFLRVSAFSRHLYAIGGNEKAARLSGVSVHRTKIIVFAICGLLAALAGIIHAGQLNTGSPNDGIGYELDAIAAVVVGGTALSGGRGSVIGTVAGALMLGVLNNIMSLNNVDTNIQLLIKGLVIVAAAGLQRLRPAS